LARRAEQEGTSLNQLVIMLLADGMGRWATGRQSAAAAPYTRVRVVKESRE
jgi:hypothetical protein